VYSTDSKKEAETLVAATCELGLDGHYYAPGLGGLDGEARITAFVAFGKRLELLHRKGRT